MNLRARFLNWFLRIHPADAVENILTEINALRNEVRNTRKGEAAHKELVEKYQQLINSVQPLRDAINTLEQAGIRRKFGGVIDVNFNKFLDSIGSYDEGELEKIIKRRRKAA